MKTILLAVSGSIAFYKAYELISLFKKENFKVKVLLSEGVLKFASRLSFEALCDSVLCVENESWENDNNHIKFSKDCDIIVFAPASVNSINKLAYGISDNLFIQTLIASSKPLIIAPAANSNMYNHFSTQISLKILEKNKAIIIKPIVKKLACKDEGIGALADIKDIFNIVKRQLFKEKFFENKNIVITCGGTKEKIDDVRFISNFSSGKMAKAIADAFYFLGANVRLLSSVEFKAPYAVYNFESSKDLKNLIDKFQNDDFLIMAAAVSDFVQKYTKGKIKKGKENLNLSLNLNEDLLKNTKFKGIKIGFKMELDEKNALDNAKKALIEKKLDMICLNILGDKNNFGSNFNQLSFITKNDISTSKLISKEELGYILARMCEKL
ncbi:MULTISPECIES: bifunctional phosphopantothenoylcysteine decarboxylase/phosphopantothenate--cysteine ligase CoaBC [unclassified Campylobacter]|uniref:bifunctional phosphopantothenoylcysteine decarboxylase/phosphopantothenate--cysteine ligase CoaBC n=1 Tax=unclassified Campylobacter TaxID=2593542 RepID=UPI001238103E|nr:MULTISPECIES: bifunctional phosphopantothenoylcysteine decarboxylase/phosphopantothenate--cysteine ligase CoaBC [unclassified Campylobacter]KAA6225610.1 bifunctional phosphopantothenoylcysteine decarboxylase/phosphopantothenate--cysteine ligase CoaBC [Campylobacter sp. LR185c]KAA6227538.1 bifunctional phosphopantothenoylcysteine decarboxylase/phosphopantothenate--cysteine ligase CoaBC [Campylobacter sp. LR196d]KAA6228565.1 bifunctional phosphopantothenoylcysteine decarboxylase/phosphopantothe